MYHFLEMKAEKAPFLRKVVEGIPGFRDSGVSTEDFENGKQEMLKWNLILKSVRNENKTLKSFV